MKIENNICVLEHSKGISITVFAVRPYQSNQNKMADASAAAAAPKVEKKRKAPSEAAKKREEDKLAQIAEACRKHYNASFATPANSALQKVYIDNMMNSIQSMVCEHIQTMKLERDSKEEVFPENEYNFEPGSHKKKKTAANEPITNLDAIVNDATIESMESPDADDPVEDDEDNTLDEVADTHTPAVNGSKEETKEEKDKAKKTVKKQLCQLSPAAKYALQSFIFDYIIDTIKHSPKDGADVKTTVATILSAVRSDAWVKGTYRITHHVCGTITRLEDIINSFPEKAYDMGQMLPTGINAYTVKNKILCRYLRVLTRFLAERIWNTGITSVSVADITTTIGILEIGNREFLLANGLIAKDKGHYIAIGSYIANRMEEAARLFVPPLTDDEKAARKAKREEAKKAKEAAPADPAAAPEATPAAAPAPAAKAKAAPAKAAPAAAAQYISEDVPPAAPAPAAAPAAAAKKPVKPSAK